jgi:hypothetical protein
VFQLDISNLCCQNERIWVDGNVFFTRNRDDDDAIIIN